MLGGSLFVLLLAVAGALLGEALARGPLPRAERWALGTAAALGLLTVAAWGLCLAGVGLPGPALQVALLAGGVLLARRARRRAPPLASAPPAAVRPVRAAPAAAVTPAARLAGLALLAALVTALLMAGDWRRAEPAGNWDGMANWTVQARHLARTDGAFGEGLRARVVGHPDYPLLLPAALALGWGWTGDETQHVPRLLAVLGLALLAAAAVGAGTRAAGPVGGRLAAAALLATPAVGLAARGQIADVPLAAFALLAGTRLVESLDALGEARAPSTPHLLTGLLLGLLPWLKNEGSVLALCLALAALPALVGLLLRVGAGARAAPRRATLAALAAVALGALPGLLAERSFKTLFAPPDRMLAQLRPALRRLLPDPERWRVSLEGLAAELFPTDLAAPLAGPWFTRWGGLAALAVGALLLAAARRPRRLLAPPVLATLGWLAALVLIYVLTLADPAWHVETSLWRLLLQMLPFTLWGALRAWSRPAATPVNGAGATGMLRDSIPTRD